MISIELYQPNAVNEKIDYPSTWDELTPHEMKVIGVGYFGTALSRAELLLAILESRLGKKRINLLPMLSIEDLSIEYMSLTEFITERIDRTESIPIENLYCPTADFEDITVGEYEEADIALSQYIADANPQHLVDFFKTYYRVDKSVQDHIPDTATMQACALCFIGCKSFLPKSFPLVFGGGEAGKQTQPDLLALTKLIHSGAGPRNGTRDNIRRMPLKEFLYDCQLEAEKAPDVF